MYIFLDEDDDDEEEEDSEGINVYENFVALDPNCDESLDFELFDERPETEANDLLDNDELVLEDLVRNVPELKEEDQDVD
ncbi:MAG: hypothetical protein EZS28_048894, partial [Streblomastix strix]